MNAMALECRRSYWIIISRNIISRNIMGALILLFCLREHDLFAAVPQQKTRAAPPPAEVIAYVFPRDKALAADEIDGEKLTRINYAFANINRGEMVEGSAYDAGNFAVLDGLKRQNPQLKLLVSVGGWTWSGGFSDMALTEAGRRRFIDSAVRFVGKYGLDGVDIDWEYPGMPGMGNPHRPEDAQHYTALLTELRRRFDLEGKRLGRQLLTSVATGASLNFLAHTEMGKVARVVDSVNLMSYDYYEPSSDKTTGHHAPLYANPRDPRHVSADASVKAYLAAGVPASKLVLGVPFYGQAWAEVNGEYHGLYQHGVAARIAASYRDIPALLAPAGGYQRYWDAEASAPYLYSAAAHTFISYDDAESLRLKCQYVLKHGLAGIMFWEYHNDLDETLLRAIDAGLHGLTNNRSDPAVAKKSVVE